MKAAIIPTLWRLLLIAAGTLGITWLAWRLGVDPFAPGNASGAANDAIQPWRWPLMLGRWIVWATVCIQWAWIGKTLFSGNSDQDKAKRNQWRSMRYRMIGGIALVEAIILFSYLTGG